jgi:nucleoside-diphosphate-sugar epimerase
LTILVLGGSSQIGHFLLPRLLARGESVIALSRRPPSDPSPVQWRLGQLPDAVPLLPPLSAIISFGPLLALAQWLADNPLVGAPSA